MNHISKLLTGIVLGGAVFFTPSAEAQDNRYLGDVYMMGANFCPRGSAAAEGQLLPINQNQSLYSVLGTKYGGDGRTSFALPDLRGRVPIGDGSGPGLTTRTIGLKLGSETNQLTLANVPSHTHRMGVRTKSNETANAVSPRQNSFATGTDNMYDAGATLTSRYMHSESVVVQPSGSPSPLSQNNMMPTNTIRYCITITGLFPPRN